MPRVYFVKKARTSKKSRRCKCGTEIQAGDSYYWWSFRYGGTYISCISCGRPRQSQLTQSDKFSRLYGAQESVLDAVETARAAFDRGSIEEIRAHLEELGDTVEQSAEEVDDVAREYEEAADSIEETFSYSPTADDCREYASQAEEFARELQDAAQSIGDAISGLEGESFRSDTAEEAAEAAETAAHSLSL